MAESVKTCRAVFDGKECESDLPAGYGFHCPCGNEQTFCGTFNCHPFDDGTSCAEAPEAIAEAQEQAIQERVGAELERLAPLCTFPGCGKPERECRHADCREPGVRCICEGKCEHHLCHPFRTEEPVEYCKHRDYNECSEGLKCECVCHLQKISRGEPVVDAPLRAAPRDEQVLVTDAMLEAARGAWFSAHDTFRDRMTAAIEAALSASLAKPAREGGTNEPLLTDDEIEAAFDRMRHALIHEGVAFRSAAKWARDTITKRLQERREA